MNATELAEALGVSKGRISQLVADGTLEGCYRGQGRARVFDARKAAEVLDKRLDPGQRLGNGAAADQARRLLLEEGGDAEPELEVPQESAPLARGDDDRYRLARTQKAEEEARRIRRQNAEEEGRYVLADAAAREMRRLLLAEISGVETVIRDGARAIADELGVDFKSARQILRDAWRAHRASRADALEAGADQVALTEAERAADL